MRNHHLGSGLALLLAACAGGSSGTYTLPEFGSGARHVVVSGDTAADGIALLGADGSGYLLLGDDSNAASTVLYRRKAGDRRWSRVPALSEKPKVSLKLNEADVASAPALPVNAVTLNVLLHDAAVAVSLQPDGTVLAGGGACRITGQLRNDKDKPFAAVSLNFDQCGSVTGRYTGVAFVDPDAPNARMRVVIDNGSDIQDFYVYNN